MPEKLMVGLAYDPRAEYLEMGFGEEETAEFDSDSTIEALEEAIAGLGYDVQRIGSIYELTKRLSSGQRWGLVFNIAEGLYGRSREAQAPALLEAYNIPYTFGDPLTLALSLDKAMAKTIIRDAGIPTPAFRLLEEAGENDFHDLDFAIEDYPLFLKPNSEGTGKGVSPDSIVRDGMALRRVAKRLQIRYCQPVLVEQYLPGREFTVGILGTGKDARVIGMMEVRFLSTADASIYSYNNKKYYEERVEYKLVRDKKIKEQASDIALKAYNILGCRDAGRIDLRADKNDSLCFLEANPLPGLNPVHSDLPILCGKAGMSYEELISEIVNSALKRQGNRISHFTFNAKIKNY
jgi:D-alanine-D-alanine ligase